MVKNMETNVNLIDLKFRKYLMKLNVLSYLYKNNLINEEIFEKSRVEIEKTYTKNNK